MFILTGTFTEGDFIPNKEIISETRELAKSKSGLNLFARHPFNFNG